MNSVGEECGSCGLPVLAADTFCGNCGQPTTTAAAVAAVTVPKPGDGAWPGGSSGPDLADAALGQATPNAQYLGHRLVYKDVPEGSFDPLGNSKLLMQFALHLLLYWVVYSIGALLGGIVLALFGLVIRNFSVAVVLWCIAAVIIGLAFACLYWLVPVPAQLSEWKFFVDGKASVAPVTFDHIAWALQQRQTPLDSVQVRRLNLAGGEGRDYLEVRRGLFSGLICSFAYGQDLYVGWTFWLRISPLRYLLMLLARLWQTLMRRGTDLYVSLRYDYARAMREAMHSAAREGVDVAIGHERPQGQGTGRSLQLAVSDLDV
jgi:hypothetical protein